MTKNAEEKALRLRAEAHQARSEHHHDELVERYLARCERYKVAPDGAMLIALKSGAVVLRTIERLNEADFLAIVETLALDCPSLFHTLDISRCKQVSSNAIFVLADLLEHPKCSIKNLILRSNRIGPRGCAMLSEALLHNSTVERLDLHGNRLYEIGALSLLEAIKSHPKLSFIDVSANIIGFKTTRLLERAAAQNPNNTIVCKIEDNNMFEEVVNSITHGIGMIAACLGLVVLLYHCIGKTGFHVAASLIYSAALITVYTSSFFLHSLYKLKSVKHIFQRLDHGAIYLLIAGTYTPVCMLTNLEYGTTILVVEWGCAAIGLTITLVADLQRWGLFELVIYVTMGWVGCYSPRDVLYNVPYPAVVWLSVGGITYTSGIYFYITGAKKKPMNHAIWHVFVMVGSIVHYIAIVGYVISDDPLANPHYYAAHWGPTIRQHLDIPYFTDLLEYIIS